MGADSGVSDGPAADFLDGGVAVGGAKVVFGEENDFGMAVVEADHGVLPIAHVVAPADVEDDVAEVVAVEEKPEGVHDAVAFVDGDQDCRGVAAATAAFAFVFAGHAFVEPSAFGDWWGVVFRDVFCTTEPLGAVFDVVVAREEDIAASLEGVELIEIH